MSTTSRGIALERKAAAYYRERGYVVASRRHFGGGGDLLAVKEADIIDLDPLARGFLVEVKGTARKPWCATWGPTQRTLLIDDAEQAGVEPVCWWKPPRGELSITGPSDWPKVSSPNAGKSTTTTSPKGKAA